MAAYNVELLREKVKDSGMKVKPLAEAIGYTREGFYKKLERETEWTPSQILTLCEYLRINEDERKQIFLI